MYYDHQQEYNFTPKPSYHEHMQEIRDTIVPVEFAGECGDVIFFHVSAAELVCFLVKRLKDDLGQHRVLHTGGVNVVSPEHGPVIRLAVPTDWQKVFDPEAVKASSHKAAAWTQVVTEGGATVPLQPDGTVASYGGGGQPVEPDAELFHDVLPWWIDGRHHGWAPDNPPREDQWEDWAI